MTEEERAAKISALVEEKRGYVMRGLGERAAAVDAQLRLLAAEGAPRVKRAEKRPAKNKAARRSK